MLTVFATNKYDFSDIQRPAVVVSTGKWTAWGVHGRCSDRSTMKSRELTFEIGLTFEESRRAREHSIIPRCHTETIHQNVTAG